ncbi:tetratricopeptide repeat protein, partial [Candidatus Chloroploca asiatica]|uniref:tetratricopeptide repeat protein n=1 Tax=Candidatus Chloroploca asiatica TaxID=1506545 RepID=UPI001143F724
MSEATLRVEPSVNFPREAVAGQSYLITVDLRTSGAWPFVEEEYAVYCMLEGGPDLRSQALGAGAVVLHRFGGSYGAAQFQLFVGTTEGLHQLNVMLVTGWGAPLGQLALSITIVAAGAMEGHLGNYTSAQAYAARALDIRERVLGPEHPATATSLNNLAELYRAQGQYAAARPLYERALDIRERVLGPEHPDTATSLNNLAELYRAQGQYAAARPLYERALDIRERVFGPEHPATAQSLNNLAGLHYAQGNYDAARPLYERALDIRERVLGP